MSHQPRHYEKIWVDDLENEESLALCSDSAWKLWVRMILYMGVKSPQRGRLLLKNGRTPDVAETAKLFKMQTRDARVLVKELEDNGVFSREDGVIVCRRQVREEKVSAARSGAADERWKMEALRNLHMQNGMQTTSKSCASIDANTHALSGYGYGSGSSSEKEEVQEEDFDTWLRAAVEAFNIGAGASGVEHAAPPGPDTAHRDALLRAARHRYPEIDRWGWCGAALGKSAHHRGSKKDATWRADILWLLTSQAGANLELWMARGTELRAKNAARPARRELTAATTPTPEQEAAASLARQAASESLRLGGALRLKAGSVELRLRAPRRARRRQLLLQFSLASDGDAQLKLPLVALGREEAR